MIEIDPVALNITVPTSVIELYEEMTLFLDTESWNLVAMTDDEADEYLDGLNDPDRYAYIGRLRNGY